MAFVDLTSDLLKSKELGLKLFYTLILAIIIAIVGWTVASDPQNHIATPSKVL